MTKAQVEAVAMLPTEWRGERYRRTETPLNPTARAEADEKASLKWSKEVLGIILAQFLLVFVGFCLFL